MLKEIIALANKLDRMGNQKEADMLDKIIEKMANQTTDSKGTDAFFREILSFLEDRWNDSTSEKRDPRKEGREMIDSGNLGNIGEVIKSLRYLYDEHDTCHDWDNEYCDEEGHYRSYIEDMIEHAEKAEANPTSDGIEAIEASSYRSILQAAVSKDIESFDRELEMAIRENTPGADDSAVAQVMRNSFEHMERLTDHVASSPLDDDQAAEEYLIKVINEAR